MVFPPGPAGRRRPLRASRGLPIVTLAFLVGLVFGVPASQAASTTTSTVEASIVNLINKDRAARGLSKLGVDSGLMSIAGDRAVTLAAKEVLSHSAPGDLQAQLNGAGVAWKLWGENIASTSFPWGPTVAGSLYSLWKGSPPHLALILSRDFNRVGVGVARAANGATYGVIVFVDSPSGSGIAPAPKPKATPKVTPKPAAKAIPKPVPEPTASPAPEAIASPAPTPDTLWIASASGGRPDGEVGAWSPWGLVEAFAQAVESIARAVALMFSWIAAIGGGLASSR